MYPTNSYQNWLESDIVLGPMHPRALYFSYQNTQIGIAKVFSSVPLAEPCQYTTAVQQQEAKKDE